MERFQEGVIDPVNNLFETFRIGEDYKLNTLMESGPEERWLSTDICSIIYLIKILLLEFWLNTLETQDEDYQPQA